MRSEAFSLPRIKTQSALASSVVVMLLGATIIAIVNLSVAPFLLAPVFLTAGLILHRFVFLKGHYERRTFALTFSIAMLLAGLSQAYAIAISGELQTTSDAQTLYAVAVNRLDAGTFDEIRRLADAPLAVIIWRYEYFLTKSLGIDDGPWVGIMLNSYVVALTGVVTVATARLIFGQDQRRLTLVGTLFAFTGIFWLFAALFLRDSFILLANTFLLYVFVRLLKSLSIVNGILVGASLLGTYYAFLNLRAELIPLLPLLLLLGLASWCRRSPGWSRAVLLTIGGVAVLLVFYPFILNYSSSGADFADVSSDFYASLVVDSGSLGLGYKLVVDQPLPIRLLTGSLYMHLFPIPLWHGFSTSLGESQWIKSYMGFYFVIIAPAGFYGALLAVKRGVKGAAMAPPVLFVALFLILGLVAVVITSLETRHYGQFIPAFLILAAIPDINNGAVHRQLQRLSFVWYGAVIAIHAMWLFLRYM